MWISLVKFYMFKNWKNRSSNACDTNIIRKHDIQFIEGSNWTKIPKLLLTMYWPNFVKLCTSSISSVFWKQRYFLICNSEAKLVDWTILENQRADLFCNKFVTFLPIKLCLFFACFATVIFSKWLTLSDPQLSFLLTLLTFRQQTENYVKLQKSPKNHFRSCFSCNPPLVLGLRGAQCIAAAAAFI